MRVPPHRNCDSWWR